MDLLQSTMEGFQTFLIAGIAFMASVLIATILYWLYSRRLVASSVPLIAIISIVLTPIIMYVFGLLFGVTGMIFSLISILFVTLFAISQSGSIYATEL